MFIEAKLINVEENQQIVEPREPTTEDLMVVHTKKYLDSLKVNKNRTAWVGNGWEI